MFLFNKSYIIVKLTHNAKLRSKNFYQFGLLDFNNIQVSKAYNFYGSVRVKIQLNL